MDETKNFQKWNTRIRPALLCLQALSKEVSLLPHTVCLCQDVKEQADGLMKYVSRLRPASQKMRWESRTRWEPFPPLLSPFHFQYSKGYLGHFKSTSQKWPIIIKLIQLASLSSCIRSSLQLAASACWKNQTEVTVDIPPITVFLITAVSMANIQTWLSTTTLFYHFSCRYVFHGKIDFFPRPEQLSLEWESQLL